MLHAYSEDGDGQIKVKSSSSRGDFGSVAGVPPELFLSHDHVEIALHCLSADARLGQRVGVSYAGIDWEAGNGIAGGGGTAGEYAGGAANDGDEQHAFDYD